jgi:hypothetical protein
MCRWEDNFKVDLEIGVALDLSGSGQESRVLSP